MTIEKNRLQVLELNIHLISILYSKIFQLPSIKDFHFLKTISRGGYGYDKKKIT
jgi:hypothetical protein